ncbi:hypothetical protein P168DRAFT_17159 [Aspergillus campestris IBT 28561]|uniref:Uncharacterized protein n=1 Tax=Aspergillus campestris (strain IBT 28561) TaxID=1392248 RepID=A0A2I1DF35_ASPC2|nr:uncharacterized protein P168DRAFT_17159 [Aspergillus campestris IBT 28561]PKY08471.1 hypothetical protein P168DRAFT_17159 [Aspergillus campestris IBT 28561]
MVLPLASLSILALHKTFTGSFARVFVGVYPRGPLQTFQKKVRENAPKSIETWGKPPASQSPSDPIVLGVLLKSPRVDRNHHHDDNLFWVGRPRDISSHANGSRRMPISVSQTITYMLHTSRLIDHDLLNRWSFH